MVQQACRSHHLKACRHTWRGITANSLVLLSVRLALLGPIEPVA